MREKVVLISFVSKKPLPLGVYHEIESVIRDGVARALVDHFQPFVGFSCVSMTQVENAGADIAQMQPSCILKYDSRLADANFPAAQLFLKSKLLEYFGYTGEIRLVADA